MKSTLEKAWLEEMDRPAFQIAPPEVGRVTPCAPLPPGLSKLAREMDAANQQIRQKTKEISILIDRVEKLAAAMQQSDPGPIGEIIAIVASHHRLAPSDLICPCRIPAFVAARYQAMFLCAVFTSSKKEDIGRAFGGRSRHTVTYAISCVTDELTFNKTTRDDINALETTLLKRFPVKHALGIR